MSIKNEVQKILDIKEGEVIVVIIPDRTYGKDIIDLTSQLAKEYNNICYVGLNKPYNSLMKYFEDKKIDKSKFFFIDAITRHSKSVKDLKNCIFIKSVSALTDLNIAITKKLEGRKFGILIFDSLSTMLIYHPASTVTKFAHSLIGMTRVYNCTVVFTCLEGDSKSALIKDLGMLVDKIMLWLK